MRLRDVGRTGWQVSEIGYRMWGDGELDKVDDEISRQALQLAVDLACNLFDTAWIYGKGRSERLHGELFRAYKDKTLDSDTKIPPMNHRWRHRGRLARVFPPDHIREYTEEPDKSRPRANRRVALNYWWPCRSQAKFIFTYLNYSNPPFACSDCLNIS